MQSGSTPVSGALLVKFIALFAALLIPALPTRAASKAILRIEAAFAAPGLAPRIDAAATDIVTLERIFDNGPGPLVELHPRYDSALTDLTKARVGQRLIISICGRVVLEPLLTTGLTQASIVITADDLELLDEIEAALRAPSCPAAAIF